MINENEERSVFQFEVNLLNDDNIACMMSEMNAAEALEFT